MSECITQPTISQGEISPKGLQRGGKVTEVVVSSTQWTALPPVALSQRNAICVQNQSNIEIKTNYESFEPLPAGYVGITIGVGQERFYDITDSIILYAKAQAGSPTITVEEIS
jgi:hypothetical protein